MNEWELSWEDYGNRIYRNNVSEDARPTRIIAHEYVYNTLESGLFALAFLNEEGEALYTFIHDFPFMIKRVNA